LTPLDPTKGRSGGPSRPGAQIWGQTRCPIYGSGTFNVKRSTLNLQRGDRKGAWWAGYGDRHEIWTTGLLTALNPTKGRAGRPKPAGRPDMGTDTMSDIPIRNVQRPTIKSQLSTGVTERAHGGRDMGTDTESGRPSSWPGGPEQGPGRAAEAGRAPKYGDRHDVRYTDQERST